MLRKIFSKQGVTSSTAIIAGAISAHSIHIAPAPLAKSTTAVVLAKSVSVSTLGLVKGTLNLMAWAKAKIAIVTAVTLATTAGLAIVALEGVPSFGDAPDASSFAAEGYVSSIFYRMAADTNQFIKIGGKVSFRYRNDGWHIQFTYGEYVSSNMPGSGPSAEEIIGETLDVKEIPDGTREIIVASPTRSPAPNVMTLAIVRSNRFPSSSMHALFLPWLSLCPKPELPLITSNRIHFEFQPELYGNPKNDGGFAAKYIGLENKFLSELVITNNGSMFTSDGQTLEYPAPYNQGFVNFSYQALATTNCNGIIFPLKAVLTQFTPAPNGKSSEDLFAAVITELSIQKIDPGGRHINFVPVPDQIFATDTRPPGFDRNLTMNYIVTNDEYLPLTDERMLRLVKMYRQANASHRPASPRPR